MLVKRALERAGRSSARAARRTSRPGASARSTSTSWSPPSSRPRTRSRRIIGIPAARQTDVFAEGKVQIVEFDVPPRTTNDALIGRPLRDAAIPADSKVAGIVRGERMIVPRGDEAIMPGDRVIVIASPASARAWSALIAKGERQVDDIVIFGAGPDGRDDRDACSHERDIRVRLVDAEAERGARGRQGAAADARLPRQRVRSASSSSTSGSGRGRAAVFCMNDDARNLYGAVLAKRRGVRLTIALTHDPVSAEVYESGGVDVAINPRQVAAEEMVRFAHDPRCRQVAMLEDDRFEVLDITVRAGVRRSPTRPFKDLPATGSVIGAVVRDGDRALPPRHRRPAGRRPRDHLRRVAPGGDRRTGVVDASASSAGGDGAPPIASRTRTPSRSARRSPA